MAQPAPGAGRALRAGQEIQESQVKQLLEAKKALSARLRRSPDLLDALLMTFSLLHEG